MKKDLLKGDSELIDFGRGHVRNIHSPLFCRVPPTTKQRLFDQSDRLGLSINAFVNMAIIRFCEEEERQEFEREQRKNASTQEKPKTILPRRQK